MSALGGLKFDVDAIYFEEKVKSKVQEAYLLR